MAQPPGGDDLVAAVRRAASQAGSQAVSCAARSRGHKAGSRRSASEASLLSRYSGGSSYSGRSSKADHMTLREQQDYVQNAAMDRYVRNLETEAKDAAVSNEVWSRRVKAGLNEERGEVFGRRGMEEENLAQLKHQMEENKARRSETRKEYIEAASSHSFPLFTETFISLDEVTEYRRKQKETFREELDAQLNVIKTLKNIQLKKDQQLAERKHRENVKSMSKGRYEERCTLQQKGRDLVNNWDRDVRLKSIKNAILSGKNMSKDSKPAPPETEIAIGRTF